MPRIGPDTHPPSMALLTSADASWASRPARRLADAFAFVLSLAVVGCFGSHGMRPGGDEGPVPPPPDLGPGETDAGPPDHGGPVCDDTPAILSVSRPRYRQQGTAVGGGRYLFSQRGTEGGTRLTLARVTDQGFEVLDEEQIPELARFVESLGPDLAMVHTEDGGRFVTLTGDRIRPRGAFALDHRTLEMALAGDHLYACIAPDWLTTQLVELDAADLDDVRMVGSIAAGCRSVVASSIGPFAYATDGWSGAWRVVPQPSGVSSLEDLGARADALHASGGFLTLATGQGVSLLREADLQVVGSVDTFWVRSARYTSRGLEVYVQASDTLELAVYETRPGETPPLVERSREIVATGTQPMGSANPWASANDGLRLIEVGRFFLLDDDEPYLNEVLDPDTAWPGAMRVDGTDILLRDGRRAVRIDASDPRRPRSVEGGEHGGADVLALELGEPGPPALYGDTRRWSELGLVDGGDWPWSRSLPEAPLAVRTFGPGQRATDGASHDLDYSADPDRRDALHLSGQSLYRTQRAREPAIPLELRLDRYPVPAFEAGPTPAPDLSMVVPSPSGDPFDVLARLHDDAAIAFTTRPSDGASAIYLLPLEPDAAPIGPFEVPWQVIDVAGGGDRVLAVGAEVEAGTTRVMRLVALERQGGALVEVGQRSWPTPREAWPGGRRILHLDRDLAYVQVQEGTPDVSGNVMVGLRLDALDGPMATYPLPELVTMVQGFEVTPYGLVLSAPDTLVIAEPWCR